MGIQDPLRLRELTVAYAPGRTAPSARGSFQDSGKVSFGISAFEETDPAKSHPLLS
jgi:hypothetical protein